MQSLLLAQRELRAQRGEQVGGWQSPEAQTREAQSPAAPHCAPWLQLGEQPGGLHVWFEPQTEDKQSPLLPQVALWVQRGEQAGAWQTPEVQTCDEQSPAAPQAAPWLQ